MPGKQKSSSELGSSARRNESDTSDTDYKKRRRYRPIPLIRVEGGHYKLKCRWMLFIWRPLRVMSAADSEPTASSRYPALHLQTLPSRMSCPHCTEAVIHSNAARNKLKYWHSPCPTGGVLYVLKSLTLGDGGGGGGCGGGLRRGRRVVMFDG